MRRPRSKRYYEVHNVSGDGLYDGSNNPKYLTGIVLAAYRDFEDCVYLSDEKLPAIELF